VIHISDKAIAAMDKYYSLGVTTDKICKNLKEDGFPDLEIEAIRAGLNGKDLSDVIEEDQESEQ